MHIAINFSASFDINVHSVPQMNFAYYSFSKINQLLVDLIQWRTQGFTRGILNLEEEKQTTTNHPSFQIAVVSFAIMISMRI